MNTDNLADYDNPLVKMKASETIKRHKGVCNNKSTSGVCTDGCCCRRSGFCQLDLLEPCKNKTTL